jgi:antitoxin CptB
MKKQDSGYGEQDSGYGIQDTETRDQLTDAEPGFLNPESCLLYPEAERRLSWRCRRGLLELDIVLGRFVADRYPRLNNEQRVVFDELLDLPDTELWDLITDKKKLAREHQRLVLEWLKAA